MGHQVWYSFWSPDHTKMGKRNHAFQWRISGYCRDAFKGDIKKNLECNFKILYHNIVTEKSSQLKGKSLILFRWNWIILRIQTSMKEIAMVVMISEVLFIKNYISVGNWHSLVPTLSISTAEIPSNMGRLVWYTRC